MEKEDKLENTVISVSLPKQIIIDMDSKAKSEYKNRSEYIKDLVLADLHQPKFI